MRSLIERTRTKFNASVAEVEDNDAHKRGVVGIAVIGNDAAHVDSMLAHIVRFVEHLELAPLTHVETEVIPLGGDLGSMAAPSSEWLGGMDAIDGDVSLEEEEW